MSTLTKHVLAACAAISLSLGAAAIATPAAAGNIDAHQESKMMRHRPMPMMMHHRGMMMRHRDRMMMHRRMMMHHKRMMQRSM